MQWHILFEEENDGNFNNETNTHNVFIPLTIQYE